MSRTHHGIRLAAAFSIFVLGMAVFAVRYGHASSTMYGSLSNFDVFNETGQETHGFEIDLEGISAASVVYEFGAPYERYGNPTVSDTPTGAKVVYASGYDAASSSWQAATPVAPTPVPVTGGHQCWTGGSASYATAGCEHFGLALNGTPTSVTYHWLIADPSTPGRLKQDGTAVSIPAPVWNVAPAPQPAVNPQPVVQAVAPAPAPEVGQMLGDAVWVKVYYAESTKASDLGHLVSGDSRVPGKSAQVETDWLLIQAGSNSLQSELASEVQPGKQAESVARRYQFFKYTGTYDPESHEATPVSDSQPQPNELGSLIGNQMAALNLPNAAPDIVPPKAIIDTKAPSGKVSSLVVKFHATDNKSKVFTYFCAVDKAIPAPCKSGLTVRTAKGSHTLKVYAVDASGTPSNATTLKWNS